jgi:hypothetical protein
MRAMRVMLSKYGTKDTGSVERQVQLFDPLVAPVLGYGSEVWAPRVPLVAPCCLGAHTLRLAWTIICTECKACLCVRCWEALGAALPAAAAAGGLLFPFGTVMVPICCVVMEAHV